MRQMRTIISGRVQGVGFRWAVERLARQHGVTGTVRNLPNGTVEVVAQGEALEAFIHDLEHNPGAGLVTQVQVEAYEAVTPLKDFKIVI